MAERKDWSPQEIAATVADYMHMLQLELAGQSYNKAAHYRALQDKLAGRSKGAVEMKRQNISAVLQASGRMWIAGYKPLTNVQAALGEEVENWLLANPDFDALLATAIDQPAVAPAHLDFRQFLVAAPESRNTAREPAAPYQLKRPALQRDYAAREASNRKLGLAGELLVLEFERQSLIAQGKGHLADKVVHASKDIGDGLGYDIHSYAPNGRDKLIEVKTTAFAKETPFYASRNEVDFSRDHADLFVLTRVFDFRKAAKAFELPGAIATNCRMDAVSYVCGVL
ncbi:DUF3883 domain-containing protein [Chitinilyticum litopenaei]|uniref:DUF3883 domain-containing protein n=1 Tax=Chitinilyticum litopenaei TaxID=1121276 RepID=UPI00041FBAF3|nr:DUF3883 domain-containing protein [Chitinilyticum litopenaei]